MTSIGFGCTDPSAGLRWLFAKRPGPRPSPGLIEPERAQSIFGRVSNWWKGGGLDRVHSSVVAPSPQ